MCTDLGRGVVERREGGKERRAKEKMEKALHPEPDFPEFLWFFLS